MIVVAIIGILAAVAIPAFVNYMKRAKTSEASVNLKSIGEGAVSYFDAETQTMLGSASAMRLPNDTNLTPVAGVLGSDKLDPTDPAILGEFTTVASWNALGWAPSKPFYYKYQWTANCGTGVDPCPPSNANMAIAEAFGNLDDDGTTSHFYRQMDTVGGMLIIKDLVKQNELE